MDPQAEHDTLNFFIDQALGASWPLFAIATIVFFMRSASRMFFTEGSIGWEDYIISLSWLLDLVRMVTFHLALVATKKVNAMDPNSLPSTVPTATFWSLFTDTWAFLSVTLPKVGVAFLLIRIFRPKAWLKTTILSVSIGLFAYCVVGFIISFVQCNPVAGQWDPYNYPNAKCWPRNVQIYYALVGSSTSAFLDIAFALYPGFVLWKLQMPLWKKLSTMAFMGLGVLAFAFAVVKVSSNTSLLGTPTLHQLYTNALHIGLWNSIENDFIIIAACLPSVRPLFKACKIFTGTQLSKSNNSKLMDSASTPSSQRSLQDRHSRHSGDEDMMELGLPKPPAAAVEKGRAIHVTHDITQQSHRMLFDGPVPAQNFN
ncbi:hypothetical protein IQ06DRAFT_382835 [Phaeosphaeriaceae sp. SRC1lsM3a]|nr:hypothetical protein IQ06DRAFT_382835 [Stagonospora sp. SRC1lsM3a]